MNPAVVYLVQTDTTAGFLSQNDKKLKEIKNRTPKKEFIVCVDSLRTLKSFARVPKNHKKMVRRGEKCTFVYPNNKAIRVVKQKEHLKFLKKIRWAYSTSSNPTGGKFDEDFAKEKADVIVATKFGFDEKNPSKIIKCGKISKRRLR
jgi:tRNA A37 threonylcarbamoyladenosine synthetase subunit TsaC/SUA5/YrdC